jgi:hypothetical protein
VRVVESGRYLMKASEKIVPIATARDFAVSCCKLFCFLSGLNGLFWFLSDFGKFTPPSEGIFLERLLYFLVAELGPIAISLSSVPLSGQWWWLGLPTGLITLVCFSRITVSRDFLALVEFFYGCFLVLRLPRLELHSS